MIPCCTISLSREIKIESLTCKTAQSSQYFNGQINSGNIYGGDSTTTCKQDSYICLDRSSYKKTLNICLKDQSANYIPSAGAIQSGFRTFSEGMSALPDCQLKDPNYRNDDLTPNLLKNSPSRIETRLLRPAVGPIIRGFEAEVNKGLDIGGKAGNPVLAAGSGVVMYAGDGVPGYGNLIIIEHSPELITTYAHNRKILVISDQTVKKGQKIAEMGQSGTDRVKLHFEVRRNGKPVDPEPYFR